MPLSASVALAVSGLVLGIGGVCAFWRRKPRDYCPHRRPYGDHPTVPTVNPRR